MVLVILIAFPFALVNGAGLEDDTDMALRIRERALQDQLGMAWLTRLCKPGGRLTGSAGLAQATETAMEIMRSAGLENVRLQEVLVPGWRRGDARCVIVSPEAYAGRELSIGALGRSIPTPDGGIEADLKRFDNLDQLKQSTAELSGGIVLIDHPFPDGVLNTFSGYGKLAAGRLFGAGEAARHGAAAVLVRSITTCPDNVPHLGTLAYKDAERKIPGAAISVEDAVFLDTLLDQGVPVCIRLEMSCDVGADVKGFNVIGEIPGSQFPQEVILVGGHIDSWDAGDGAHDNGAGCIHSMEALSLFKRLGLAPRRTLRCVLFVSEEYGSHGAKSYAEWQKSQDETLLAALESDRGGFVPRGLYVQGDLQVLDTMNRWLPVLGQCGIDWIRPGGSGADTSHLDMATMRAGLVVDSQRYFDLHHSANDTLDKVHPRELELGSAAMATLLFLVSEYGLPDPAPMEMRNLAE